eukprot:symbB.v1.2.013148.t1/scaffold925.1/size151535/15
MAVHILSLPEQEPPSIAPSARSSLSGPPQNLDFVQGICGSNENDQNQKTGTSFWNVYQKMQALHEMLLEAHEAELSGKISGKELPLKYTKLQEDSGSPASPTSLPGVEAAVSGLTNHMNKTKSKTASAASLNVPDDAEMRVSSARSSGESSASPRSTKISNKLLKKARETTGNMDDQIEADSLDSALQLREEWDLPEDKLLDLKRLQRRMSIGSLASMQQVVVKRQYLLKSVNQDLPCYIVHPSSYKRLFWDCLAIIFIVFEIIVSPLHLFRMRDSVKETAEILQWVASGFWALDIPASFFTAVYVNDIFRARLRDIAWNYVKSWCVFDVLMLTADIVVLVFQDTDVQAGVLRVARSRRLFRLLRMFQIIRLWRVLQGFPSVQNQLAAMRGKFGSLLQPVIAVGLCMALAVHILGSLWFAVGDTEGGWAREEALHEEVLARQYTRSMEWALGRLPPSSLKFTIELSTPAERWLGILGTAMALLVGSIFVSILTNTMAEVARERNRTTKILQSVRRYCSTYSISYGYTRQMKRYVEREHRRNEIQSHMSLLQTLPEGMVRELFQEARSSTLHSHVFFKELGLSDPSMEMNLCSQAVSELYYLAGDVIFDTSSKTQGMYLIAAGSSIYFYWSQSHSTTRKRKDSLEGRFQRIFAGFPGREKSDFEMAQSVVDVKDYVAEAALWVKAWRHQGQLQSLVETRVLMVSTDNLFKVLQGFANCMANTIVYARYFVKELNKTAHLYKHVTDLPLAPLPNEHAGKTKTRSGSLTSIFAPGKGK